MPIERKPRPHEKGPCPFPLTPLEEIVHYDIPQTEEEWERVGKLKKLDANDLVHMLGPEGFRNWLDSSPTYVYKWDESEIVNGNEIMRHYPVMRDEVIQGLLRRSEIMNIVAPPKSSKSWLGMNIAMNVIGGGILFEEFKCEQGRVLIVDNELHCETISRRLRDVAPALNVPTHIAGKYIDFLPLRGRLTSIEGLMEKVKFVRKRAYNIVILDAFYKFYPTDRKFDENSNGDVARLYTELEELAEHLDSALILIHHSSKGSGAEKSVTDMGAGAGSQSRACDAHLVIRQHEEDGVFVIDCANRSFKSIDKFCAKFVWPEWRRVYDLDPNALKGLNKKKSGDGYGSQKIGGAPAAPGEQRTLPAPTIRMSKEDKRMDSKRRAIEFICSTLVPVSQKEIISNGEGLGFWPWSRYAVNELMAELVKDKRMRVFEDGSGQKATSYVPFNYDPEKARETISEITGRGENDGYTAGFEDIKEVDENSNNNDNSDDGEPPF